MREIFPYYTRGQRIGIVVLVFILIIILALSFSYKRTYTYRGDFKQFDSVLAAQVESLNVRTLTYDSIRNRYYDKTKSSEFKQHVAIPAEPFMFDPNTLDSAGFVRLGFPWYIAKNIVKYRQKGGRFKKPQDLYKIYSIDSSVVDRLIGYISIDSIYITENVSDSSKSLEKNRNLKLALPDGYIVELNTADTSEILKLPHIGLVRARQIVRYRKALGGFYSVKQILECCSNMSDSDFSDIEPHVAVDITKIKKILINRSSVERLKNHPYISFYQAKAIYEYRWDNGGVINNAEELSNIQELTEEDIMRLNYYFDFSVSEK